MESSRKLSVPLDVVRLIVESVAAEFIPGSTDLQSMEAHQTMSQCVSVSKAWRHVAIPILWRDVYLTFICDDTHQSFLEALKAVSNDDPFHAARIERIYLWFQEISMCRTRRVTKAETAVFLCNNPHLSCHVRQLTLQPIDEENQGRPTLASMTPEELAKILEALPGIRSLHLWSIWIDLGPQAGRVHSHFQFPELEQLYLQYDADGALLPAHRMLAILSVLTKADQVTIERRQTEGYGSSQRSSETPTVRCRVQSLVVDDERRLLDILVVLVGTPALDSESLHTLQIGSVIPYTWPHLQDVMTKLAPRLKRLELDLDTLEFKSSEYADEDVDFRFLEDCSHLQCLKIRFHGETRNRNWPERSGFMILYHILTHLVRSEAPLRVLKLEVRLTEDLPEEWHEPLESKTISAGLKNSRKFLDIEDLILQLPQLESVLVAHYIYPSERTDLDELDKMLMDDLWSRLREKGILRYEPGERFDPAMFNEQCKETARWQ